MDNAVQAGAAAFAALPTVRSRCGSPPCAAAVAARRFYLNPRRWSCALDAAWVWACHSLVLLLSALFFSPSPLSTSLFALKFAAPFSPPLRWALQMRIAAKRLAAKKVNSMAAAQQETDVLIDEIMAPTSSDYLNGAVVGCPAVLAQAQPAQLCWRRPPLPPGLLPASCRSTP